MSISVAIIIPAYREGSYIENTLHSIEKSVQYSIEKKWIPHVVIVVNNPISVSETFRKDNKNMIQNINDLRSNFSFTIDILDFTEPGLVNGVGEARRNGMEFAVSKYLKNPQDLIVSLDADCTVDLNYIATLFSIELQGSAFTLGFEHKLEFEEISYYELYLRYLKSGLLLAKSPFAFYSIGSCLGTNVKNYKKVGGMVVKSATEDFHFLNKLRKIGPIENYPQTTVYPSTRLSERVTLGTGFFLTQAQGGFQKAFEKLLLPSPSDFELLGKTLSIVYSYDGLSSMSRLFEINNINEIYQDLYQRGVIKKIHQIFESTTQTSTYHARLMEVLDGLETLRILRSMWMKRSAPNSPKIFMNWASEMWKKPDILTPKELLLVIRKQEKIIVSEDVLNR